MSAMRSIDQKIKTAKFYKEELGKEYSSKAVTILYSNQWEAVQYYMDTYECGESEAIRQLILCGVKYLVGEKK